MHSVWILIAAAAGVALIHAILPDHWMPTAIVGRAERWSVARTARVGAWTAVGHVGGSLLLAFVLIPLGLGVGALVRVEGPVVGGILALTGVGYLLWGWRQRHRSGQPPHHAHAHPHPHPHPAAHEDGDEHLHEHRHEHEQGHEHGHQQPHDHLRPDHDRRKARKGLRTSLLIPLGIAASPDPTILPVLLSAGAVGVGAAVEVLATYVVVTLVVMTGLTIAATLGGLRLQLPWLERNAETFTALVLIGLGVAAWAAL